MNLENSKAAGYVPPSWRKIISRLLLAPFILGFLLFLPCLNILWVKGWVFLIICYLGIIVAVIYLRKVNPEIFLARSKINKQTRFWDKIVISLLLPSFYAIIFVASLDDGRFKWSQVSCKVVVVGYILFATGFIVMTWAEAVNRFFEPGVRIQTERGHYVVTTGPYAFVRHPGYASALVLCVGMALSLGSLWALVPVCLGMAILIVRTILEDRMLQRELAGYKEYAQKVRYRLIPGVW